jgi:hypothetical protein
VNIGVTGRERKLVKEREASEIWYCVCRVVWFYNEVRTRLLLKEGAPISARRSEGGHVLALPIWAAYIARMSEFDYATSVWISGYEIISP